MRLVGLEAEHLAGKIESADLAAAVAQELADAHAARHDPVEVVGRLALTEDFGVAARS